MNEAVERIKAWSRGKVRDDAEIRTKAAGESAAEYRGDRNILVTATTSAVDMDGEVVLPDGAVPDSYFFKNLCVFYDHTFKDPEFVGKVRRGYPKRVGDGWEIMFRARRSERGEQLIRDHEDFGASVSIGFDAIVEGKPTAEEAKQFPGAKNIIRKWNWLETSVTWTPCNPYARGEATAPADDAPEPPAGKAAGIPSRVKVTIAAPARPTADLIPGVPVLTPYGVVVPGSGRRKVIRL